MLAVVDRIKSFKKEMDKKEEERKKKKSELKEKKERFQKQTFPLPKVNGKRMKQLNLGIYKKNKERKKED